MNFSQFHVSRRRIYLVSNFGSKKKKKVKMLCTFSIWVITLKSTGDSCLKRSIWLRCFFFPDLDLKPYWKTLNITKLLLFQCVEEQDIWCVSTFSAYVPWSYTLQDSFLYMYMSLEEKLILYNHKQSSIHYITVKLDE